MGSNLSTNELLPLPTPMCAGLCPWAPWCSKFWFFSKVQDIHHFVVRLKQEFKSYLLRGGLVTSVSQSLVQWPPESKHLGCWLKIRSRSLQGELRQSARIVWAPEGQDSLFSLHCCIPHSLAQCLSWGWHSTHICWRWVNTHNVSYVLGTVLRTFYVLIKDTFNPCKNPMRQELFLSSWSR